MSKVGFISLGCSKNLVDTELMIGLVTAAGHTVTNDIASAEIVVINTCGFIDDAKEEAISAILDTAVYKEQGTLQRLLVTGCLAQRYKDEILKEMPEVDAVIGVDEMVHIAELLEDRSGLFVTGCESAYPEAAPRIRTTPPYMAYLKISDGCDNHCTYCAIPSIRGRYRSRRIEDIVAEATAMYQSGVREVNLIAQDTTRYGADLYGTPQLPRLLEALAPIGFPWIRVFYTYAELIDDALLQTMQAHDNIVPYFDIPLQHISDNVLKRMGRRDTQENIRALLTKIRTVMPNATLRTTFIVGFPGETDADFEALCAFVAEGTFDRIGVFRYSPEEGTSAARLPQQIDEETKMLRYDRLMQIAGEVSAARCAKKVGTVQTVLTEGFEDLFYVGRSAADGPEVDGKVYFAATREVPPGTFAQVKILQAEQYDLIGEMLNECSE